VQLRWGGLFLWSLEGFWELTTFYLGSFRQRSDFWRWCNAHLRQLQIPANRIVNRSTRDELMLCLVLVNQPDHISPSLNRLRRILALFHPFNVWLSVPSAG
jgi:hypothetical protein